MERRAHASPSAPRCMAAATLIAVQLGVACGCHRQAQPRPLQIDVLGAQVEATLGFEPTAADRAGDGSLAVGTRRGGVVVVSPDGHQRWLLRDAADRSVSAQGAAQPLPPKHDGRVVALRFSHDASHLLSVGARELIWWDLAGGDAARQIRGPQRLTTALLEPGDAAALFGTDEGHLLRWRFARSEAEPVVGQGCGALPVDSRRRRLPEAKRCPFGSYLELPNGQGVCTYPLTHLARGPHGALAQACRTGDLTVSGLPGATARRYLATGALGALVFVDETTLLLAREDGELRFYDDRRGEVVHTVRQRYKPLLAAANAAGIAAVASRRAVAFWSVSATHPAGGIELAVAPVWLQLNVASLRVLQEDGRLLRYRLRLR